MSSRVPTSSNSSSRDEEHSLQDGKSARGSGNDDAKQDAQDGKSPEKISFEGLEFVHATHLDRAMSILTEQKFIGQCKTLRRPPLLKELDTDSKEERERKKAENRARWEATNATSAFTAERLLVWFTVLPRQSLLTEESARIPNDERITQAEGTNRFGEIGFVIRCDMFFDNYRANYGEYTIYRLPCEAYTRERTCTYMVCAHKFIRGHKGGLEHLKRLKAKGIKGLRFEVSTLWRRDVTWDQIQFCAVVSENGLRFPRKMTVTVLEHKKATCVPKFIEYIKYRYFRTNLLAKNHDGMVAVNCDANTTGIEKALSLFPIGVKVKFKLHYMLCNKCDEIVAVSHRCKPWWREDESIPAIAPHNLVRLESHIKPKAVAKWKDEESRRKFLPLLRKGNERALCGSFGVEKFTCPRQSCKQILGVKITRNNVRSEGWMVGFVHLFEDVCRPFFPGSKRDISDDRLKGLPRSVSKIERHEQYNERKPPKDLVVPGLDVGRNDVRRFPQLRRRSLSILEQRREEHLWSEES